MQLLTRTPSRCPLAPVFAADGALFPTTVACAGATEPLPATPLPSVPCLPVTVEVVTPLERKEGSRRRHIGRSGPKREEGSAKPSTARRGYPPGQGDFWRYSCGNQDLGTTRRHRSNRDGLEYFGGYIVERNTGTNWSSQLIGREERESNHSDRR